MLGSVNHRSPLAVLADLRGEITAGGRPAGHATVDADRADLHGRVHLTGALGEPQPTAGAAGDPTELGEDPVT